MIKNKIILTAAGITIGVIVCGGAVVYYYYKSKRKNLDIQKETGDDIQNSNAILLSNQISIQDQQSDKSKAEEDVPKVLSKTGTPEIIEKTAIIDALSNMNIQSLNAGDIEAINYALTNFPDDGKITVLKQIGQAAAFSSNMDIIRDGKCLTQLQDLLHKAIISRNSISSPVTLNVVLALVNLACNEENQILLNPSVCDLVNLAENIEESEMGIAALKTLSNLSLTNICHDEMVVYIPYFYSLLDEEEFDVLKQVIAILLNLSCETNTIPELLGTEAPEADLVELSSGQGSMTVANGLLTPWIRFMKNLFFAVKDSDWDTMTINCKNKADQEDSMMAKLQEIRVQMKHKIFLLTSNKDCSGELGIQAREFYDCLQPAV